MSWHVQPPQDIYVNGDTAVVGVDPSVADTAVDQQERKTVLSSKVGMDATRFPALSVPPQEAQSPSYSAAYRCLRTLSSISDGTRMPVRRRLVCLRPILPLQYLRTSTGAAGNRTRSCSLRVSGKHGSLNEQGAFVPTKRRPGRRMVKLSICFGTRDYNTHP
jgi:hypothetical protein